MVPHMDVQLLGSAGTGPKAHVVPTKPMQPTKAVRPTRPTRPTVGAMWPARPMAPATMVGPVVCRVVLRACVHHSLSAAEQVRQSLCALDAAAGQQARCKVMARVQAGT